MQRTIDQFNRQLHPDEKRAIKNIANGDAEQGNASRNGGSARRVS